MSEIPRMFPISVDGWQADLHDKIAQRIYRFALEDGPSGTNAADIKAGSVAIDIMKYVQEALENARKQDSP